MMNHPYSVLAGLRHESTYCPWGPKENHQRGLEDELLTHLSEWDHTVRGTMAMAIDRLHVAEQ